MAEKEEDTKVTKDNDDQGECKQGAGENSSSSKPTESRNDVLETKVMKEIKLRDLFKAIFTSFSAEPPEDADKKRDEIIRTYLKQIICAHKISNSYNILILHDQGRMIKSDADHIYRAATAFCDKKPLLLVLYSAGGVIDSAYLIGKLCRECAHEKFVVVVPRQAKSAATLICCAADEIHMGSLSELGPIDPQIGQLPALCLKSAVEHIADLISDYPHAADMFAKYLHLSLDPIHLGYYERVAESAAQYAERLLKTHEGNLKKPPAHISKELVYSYKDHGFVIDKSEAVEIFGKDIIRTNTEEYTLGDAIYEALMHVDRMADIMEQYFYLIGSCDSPLNFRKKDRN
jgi:hypothetical protein